MTCGAGVRTGLAKRRVGLEGRVIGLDVDGGMTDAARRFGEGLGIDWLETDACGSGLPSGGFDVEVRRQELLIEVPPP